jgi:hypothetical protein
MHISCGSARFENQAFKVPLFSIIPKKQAGMNRIIQLAHAFNRRGIGLSVVFPSTEYLFAGKSL